MAITGCTAQSIVLKQVPGLPSTEVYDLLTDRRGFLWIAHNGGISKYDGISFTNFSNPQQSSLSVTGLLEDKYGRIWFNNFTGQIFYIENGRMSLLDGYDSKDEPNFPRIGLFKDLLVATTKRGLFVCDINTLKCHYETCKSMPGAGTSSLAVLNDNVLAYGNKHWLTYSPGAGLRLAYLNNRDTKSTEQNIGTLNVKTFNDTAFLFCNPASMVYKLVTAGDSLKICSMQGYKYYINTITVQNNSYWINTVKYSQQSPGNNLVNGYNLSSITADKQGHIWYGSLKNGFITNFESENPLKNQCNIPLLKGDIIQCVIKNGNTLLISTQNGKLISYDPISNQSALLMDLPAQHNGISYLKLLGKDKVLISSAVNTSVFNISTRKIEQVYPFMSIKQAVTTGNSMVFATSSGLVVQPDTNGRLNYNTWVKEINAQFAGLKLIDGSPFKYWGVEQRTRSVCYIDKTQTIWAAFKNGLHTVNKAGVKPFYFDGLPVYASCLAAYHDEVIAGTFNNGILVIGNSVVKHLSTEDGLLSKNIFKLKIIGNNLWIYSSGLVQIFDLKTLKLTNNYQLPGVTDAIVTDADEANGQPLLADVNGLYKIPPAKNYSNTSVYLGSLIINGRDTGILNNARLPYYKNDIQINLAIPELLNGRDITVKFRLSSTNNSKWAYGKTGERNFRFESLMPGAYKFEACAMKPQTGLLSRPFVLNFTILSPWWLRWWSLTIAGLFATALIISISRLYYVNVLKIQRIEYEKELAVQAERQRISAEMHDDIGAGLSAIKLYSSLYNTDGSPDARHLYETVSELSDKVREVVWSLNSDNDSVESLLYFIQLNCTKLFEHSIIKLKTELPEIIPEIKVNGFVRRNVYLIVKEAVHNILKHSNAAGASLLFKVAGRHLFIDIKDNGDGFHNSLKGKTLGMGIKNIHSRTNALNGKISIKTDKGTHIQLKIPI